ncbi:UNVERIFIED_CONTAM: putative protein ycf68 [Sesamum indicum]
MIGRKASVGGFLSPPSNPRAQPWTGGGNYQAGELTGARTSGGACGLIDAKRRTLPGLDMPRILLKERGAFGNADTGGAWLSSARATAGDKPEEGEDDVKSSCPLCPGRHTCYNGRDKGLQLACMKPESLVIAGQPYGGEFVPRALYTPPVTLWELAMPEVVTLNPQGGGCRRQASDWSEVGELMLVGYFGLTLLHTQNKKKGATSELNLEMEVFFHFSTVNGLPVGGSHDGLLAQWALSHMDSSMCSSAPGPWRCGSSKATLAWRTPPEDRWGDSGEIQCRSNFRFTRGIRAVRGGPPRLLSSRESIHPYQCMDSYLSSTGLGSASMGKENGAPNNASSQTKNYEITPFILGKSVEILFPFRRDQEIGSSRKKNAWCDDLLHGRGLWFKSRMAQLRPGKRIEEAI